MYKLCFAGGLGVGSNQMPNRRPTAKLFPKWSINLYLLCYQCTSYLISRIVDTRNFSNIFIFQCHFWLSFVTFVRVVRFVSTISKVFGLATVVFNFHASSPKNFAKVKKKLKQNFFFRHLNTICIEIQFRKKSIQKHQTID